MQRARDDRERAGRPAVVVQSGPLAGQPAQQPYLVVVGRVQAAVPARDRVEFDGVQRCGGLSGVPGDDVDRAHRGRRRHRNDRDSRQLAGDGDVVRHVGESSEQRVESVGGSGAPGGRAAGSAGSLRRVGDHGPPLRLVGTCPLATGDTDALRAGWTARLRRHARRTARTWPGSCGSPRRTGRPTKGSSGPASAIRRALGRGPGHGADGRGRRRPAPVRCVTHV